MAKSKQHHELASGLLYVFSGELPSHALGGIASSSQMGYHVYSLVSPPESNLVPKNRPAVYPLTTL
jgi:hypothetical protein